MEVKRLDRDFVADIFGQGRMDILNVAIVRDLYDVGQREMKWEKETFLMGEKIKNNQRNKQK